MIRRLTLALALTLAAALPAAAGPFDDLNAADRAALRDEIRAYLLENPEVLLEAMDVLEARRAEAEAARAATLVAENLEAIRKTEGHFVGGNPDGDVTVVEFMDYQCSYCRRAHPEIAELLQTDPGVRLIQRELPVLGPQSEAAARAAVAVLQTDGPQVYARLSDLLMTHQGEFTAAALAALAEQAGADVAAMRARMDSAAVSAVLRENLALARTLEVNGTPTFVVGERW